MAVDIITRTSPIHFIPEDQIGTIKTVSVDVKALEEELRRTVRGEVRFDGGSRGMYSHDAGNYRMVPLGVVIPLDAEDVMTCVAAARRYGAPILSRGGGTGIPGQSVNTAVLMDFSKYMNRVLKIDKEKQQAVVQPGVVLDSLNRAARREGLIFGPDPATHSRCTLGGMMGNNSCGIHSQMAGRTSDHIEELDILLYDGTRMRVGKTGEEELEQIIRTGGRKGEIYGKLKALRDKYSDLIRQKYPEIPRRISGYNLNELLPENGFHVARALIGSESTCVVILEAVVKLIPDPPVRSLLMIGYPDVFTAADHVVDAIPFKPVGLEGLDKTFLDDMAKKGFHDPDAVLLPEGAAWLMCEFGGNSKEEADAQARALMEDLKRKSDPPPMRLFDDADQEKHLWGLREEGLGATARVPGEPDNYEGWEDSAVPPDKLGAYMRDIKKLMDKYGYEGSLYGHFGQGCLHTRLNFDLETAKGLEEYRRFVQEAADLVAKYGGSLSGEHGDGQARGELLTRMFGEEMIEAFREFKSIWDPNWKMNPGKVVAPFRIDENLTLGTHYNPPDPKTHFQFPDDKYSFSYASLRCVGAGVCRRLEGGTMCPSYMVTREEKHSTRGRARLLFEMLQGDPVKGGWKSEAVKDALDLCLSCKGCKGDCPVQVDMATYKSEFLSHYFEGRLRPITAYSMGLIHWWARFAALAPGIVNFVTHAPILRNLAKALAGIDPARDVPAFAPMTFKEWFRKRTPQNVGKTKVILWADTFNNHFHPNAAKAAVEVLEAAGFYVEVPRQALCCGRPLYDWGMLDGAKRLLEQILVALKSEIENGTSVVVLEPSCASVFRDELVNLMPHNEDAMRLSRQTFLLSEFLEQKAPDFKPPELKRKAVVHGHCHHKSLMKMNAEEAVLKKLGLDFQTLDSGCCGMAGAFGFEKGEHYDVSIRCGERVLLPEVRGADKSTLIISDGFSCREQIAQQTDRQAIHLSQVIRMALHEDADSVSGDYPEKVLNAPTREEKRRSAVRTMTVVGVGALLIGGALWTLRTLKCKNESCSRG